MNNVSFETLKASPGGRILKTAQGRHEVKCTMIKLADGRELLSIRSWIGSPAKPGSTGGYSEPSLWSHLVIDDQMNLVASGAGPRERDSYAMIAKQLAAKGLGVTTKTRAHPGDTHAPHASAKSPDLTPGGLGPDAAHTAFRERLTWNEGDIEILTPEQAAETLGLTLDQLQNGSSSPGDE